MLLKKIERMIQLAWLIPVFPLVGFLITSLGGKKMPKSVSGALASLMVLASFVVTIAIFTQFDGQPVTLDLFNWISSGTLAIPFSFLFVLCGVLRLVKFNIITEASETKADFIGMPIPSAAGIIITYYLFFGELKYPNVFFFLMLISSILMVSLITFKAPGKVFSFVPKKLKMPFSLIILIFMKYTLFPFLLIYISLNVLSYLQEWSIRD